MDFLPVSGGVLVRGEVVVAAVEFEVWGVWGELGELGEAPTVADGDDAVVGAVEDKDGGFCFGDEAVGSEGVFEEETGGEVAVGHGDE